MPINTLPNSFLMIPTRLDALYLKEDKRVIEPFARFDQLPYTIKNGNSTEAFNFTQPYTSDTALTKPFQNYNHWLEKGVHLHWALPDALTIARKWKKEDSMTFPEVPNRWLVLRFQGDSTNPEKKWIVMSDFLWPEGMISRPSKEKPWVKMEHLPTNLSEDSRAQFGSFGLTNRTVYWPYITYHQSPIKMNGGNIETFGQYPFRYQGWVESFNGDWNPPNINAGNRVKRLTTLGYGEKTFAAFYPNCQGVFGIHDPEPEGSVNLRYEVYGWYDDSQEFLTPFMDSFQVGEARENLEWPKALEDTFGWTALGADQETALPERLMCYAKIKLGGVEENIHVSDTPSNVNLALGNTGTEALSAYLAESIDANNKEQIENQLESLLLRRQLPNKSADFGSLFEEARHTKTFHSVSGGRLWAIRPDTDMDSGQGDSYKQLDKNPFLSSGIEERLHQINDLQKQFNQANEGLKCLQRQIFADWHQYMRCSYHNPEENFLPNSIVPTFPEIDRAKAHIEKLLDLLKLKKAYVGKINYDPTKHESGEDPWTAKSLLPSDDATLPNSEGLFHLTPQINTGFEQWLNNWQPGALSLADEIAESLNRLAKVLHTYDDLISEFKKNYQELLNSEQETDTTKKLSYSKLLEIAANVDNWFGLTQTPDGLVLPEPLGAKASLEAIKEEEQNEKANTLLQNLLKPFAQLPLLHLNPTAAPRYWQPNDPVLLLAGSAVKSTDRHGMDNIHGHLLCRILDNITFPNTIDSSFINKLIQFSQNISDTDAGSNQTSGNPWHPLFFEWEAVVNPVEEKGNHATDSIAYEWDFIKDNYNLDEKKAEYTPKEVNSSLNTYDAYFNGRSILTPYAEEKLLWEIEDYIIELARHYRFLPSTQAPGNTDPNELEENDPAYRQAWLSYFDEHESEIESHFDEKHQSERSRVLKMSSDSPVNIQDKSVLSTIIKVWEKIKDWRRDQHFIQTQTLSGFNNALLMLHQTLQLEIAEPNGFSEYTAFSEKVKKAVGFQNLLSAMPKGAFHPIRSGALGLYRLRLVDTFGQAIDLIDQAALSGRDALPKVTTPNYMSGEDNKVLLPPRITQPTRLHFRWLSANSHELEVNAHPNTSPICGWILANHLDKSLMVYAAEGQLLGYIDQTARWRTAPGKQAFPIPESIPNTALRKMVNWFIKQAQDGGTPEQKMNDRLNELEDIVSKIAPSDYAQHRARSLLMGRPIALVQAVIDLQLKGWPAVNHKDILFKRIVEGEGIPYYTDGFTEVEIPVRIGEDYRVNDGVVGYWEDLEEGYRDNKFHMPGPEDALTIQQSIAAPPQRLAILMDPRGLIHCTTGILPTKALSIPKAHYIEALKNIEVTFLTAPVLSDARHLHLTLPEEPGFTWSWIEQMDDRWVELSQRSRLRRQDVLAAFENGDTIWRLLLENGWIDLVIDHPEMAYLRKPEERTTENLFSDEKKTEDIDRALNIIALGIVPPVLDARFGLPTIIREGWLSLKSTNQSWDT